MGGRRGGRRGQGKGQGQGKGRRYGQGKERAQGQKRGKGRGRGENEGKRKQQDANIIIVEAVIVRGNTFPLRHDLSEHGFTWDAAEREWWRKAEGFSDDSVRWLRSFSGVEVEFGMRLVKVSDRRCRAAGDAVADTRKRKNTKRIIDPHA